jgi:hypothetical protein
MVVQVSHGRANPLEPVERHLRRHPLGILFNLLFQRLARHVLHDDPAILMLVGANVVQRDQVRVLEVQAVRNAAELDLEVPANQL